MRITYRTLAGLIALMSDEQKDSDVTVEVNDECFAADLQIAGTKHDSLEENHPFILAHTDGKEHECRNDVRRIAGEIDII